MLTKLFVISTESGEIHEVGTDCHDSLWVNSKGVVQYYNLQNSGGTGDGYEFVAYDPTIEEFNPIEKLVRSKN